jgi:hypothetical protein
MAEIETTFRGSINSFHTEQPEYRACNTTLDIAQKRFITHRCRVEINGKASGDMQYLTLTTYSHFASIAYRGWFARYF